MNLLLKATACVLISLVLYHTIPSDKKELSLLLSVAACCAVTVSAISYLQPVLDFFSQLQSLGNLNSNMITIMMKVVGIGLLSEVTSVICHDAGNAALGKVVQILATSTILWISLPVLEEFVTLIESVMGAA